MRALLLSLILFAPGLAVAEEGSVPIVIELFTSEGCNSCPRADSLLRNLAGSEPLPGVEVVPLAFHVDYWDTPYWADPYASPEAGRRQRAYLGELGVRGVYTPQMIVDGREEFVGSDRKSALRALMLAQRRPRAQAHWEVDAAGVWELVITALPADAPALTVWLALTERNLGGHEITGGENEGRTLRHESVVRHLANVAEVSPDAELPVRIALQFPADADWKLQDLTVIAMLQQGDSGPIFGVARRDLQGR